MNIFGRNVCVDSTERRQRSKRRTLLLSRISYWLQENFSSYPNAMIETAANDNDSRTLLKTERKERWIDRRQAQRQDVSPT